MKYVFQEKCVQFNNLKDDKRKENKFTKLLLLF